jgi:DNA-directed RNA polymerase subunit H (RpoH/RPB5)
MEETALKTLSIMFERRGLDINEETVENDEKVTKIKANFYTIGSVLVCFSQKDKVLANDIDNIVGFSERNGYTNGVVIVANSPPSENVLRVAKSHAKDRVVFFHISQLQFDITAHRMAMPHRILSEEERTAVFNKFKISEPENQLPWLDSQDAMVKWIGAIPGDVVEVTRHSDTAGRSAYYRYVVEDVNVAQ